MLKRTKKKWLISVSTLISISSLLVTVVAISPKNWQSTLNEWRLLSVQTLNLITAVPPVYYAVLGAVFSIVTYQMYKSLVKLPSGPKLFISVDPPSLKVGEKFDLVSTFVAPTNRPIDNVIIETLSFDPPNKVSIEAGKSTPIYIGSLSPEQYLTERWRVVPLSDGELTVKIQVTSSYDQTMWTKHRLDIEKTSPALKFTAEDLSPEGDEVLVAFSLMNVSKEAEITIYSIELEPLGVIVCEPFHSLTYRAELKQANIERILSGGKYEKLRYQESTIEKVYWKRLLDPKQVVRLRPSESESFYTRLISIPANVSEISFKFRVRYHDSREESVAEFLSDALFLINFFPASSDGRTAAEKLKLLLDVDLTLIETYPVSGHTFISSKTATPICKIETTQTFIKSAIDRFGEGIYKSIDFLTLAGLKDARAVQPLIEILLRGKDKRAKFLSLVALYMFGDKDGLNAIKQAAEVDRLKEIREVASQILQESPKQEKH